MNTLRAGPLLLEPLTVSHAPAMFAVLGDPALYRHLDQPPPPSLEHLQSVYARLETRRSPHGRQQWLNWVVSLPGTPPFGYVQATVTEGGTAWIAYVLSSQYWGHGHATQAMQAVVEHLAGHYGVTRYLATVEAENRRSIGVLQRLAFRAASEAELEGHDLSPTERLFVRHDPAL
ncbi:MAG: GNAT family N-acetyltransferase [Betaproteobacteria bacterium]